MLDNAVPVRPVHATCSLAYGVVNDGDVGGERRRVRAFGNTPAYIGWSSPRSG